MKKSLKRMAIRSILFGALIFLILLILTEMILFIFPTMRSYKREMEHDGAYLTELIGEPYIRDILSKTKKIYYDTPEELRQKQFDEQYKSLFYDLIDDDFFTARDYLEKCRLQTEMVNTFLCFFDEEKERLVFVIDGNDAEHAFIPGQWVSSENGTIDSADIIKRTVNSNWYMHVTYGKAWGWTATDYHEVKDSEGNLLGYVTTTLSMNNFTKNVRGLITINIPILIINILIFLYLITGRLMSRIIAPINKLAAAAKEYGSVNAGSNNLGKKVFQKYRLNTGDEIEELWETMVDMENDISAAMKTIVTATAKEERLAAELDFAKSIQRAALPDKFPAFPDRGEFDVYASMTPAKEVGGDFYDFFLTDKDHLCVVIADVSGKGVPAALFMMTCKSVIKSTAQHGGSPASIMTYVNERLCEEDYNDMFVTAWLGILDIATGEVTACNAGHEYPFVTDESGRYQKFEDPHGVVCGILEGMTYEDYSFTIPRGGRLFVYTDGVAEALNTKDEMFSLRRIEETLNTNAAGSALEVVESMKKEVEKFSDKMEQFDDITMLCLEYRG